MIALVAALFAMAANCKKPVDPNGRQSFIKGESVFILNEGAFQQGNGSVSVYNKTDKEVENNLFRSINGENPGDVVQSMRVIDGEGYIVVNNSQKIEVAGLDSLLRMAQINGFTSPRYILKVADNKAYVSELFGDSLAIVDLSTHSITGKIGIAGWTEEMMMHNGRVLVGNNSDEFIYIVDPLSDSIVGKITLLAHAKSMAHDSDGDIWVLCSGTFSGDVPQVFELDKNDFSVKTQFQLSGGYAGDLTPNAAGDAFYFLNSGLFKFSSSDNQAPSSALIPAGTHSWYAIGVDPSNDDLYLGDAGDFSSNGAVYRFSSNLTAIDTIPVGIAPGYFLFY